MFRRRVPLPVTHRLRQLIWPRSGWWRAGRYVAHRLGRLPGTPYRIAAGFACGAAISFTPFMGFHFLGGALLALLMRGNVVASAIGTAVGNPWTFPFIWLWTYNLGCWMLGNASRYRLPSDLTMGYVFDNLGSVLWPMILGGLPTGVVAWFLFFWPVYIMVTQYQRARLRRRQRKADKHTRREARVAMGIQGSEQKG